ncbi:Zinc finger and BTB domain-containing protein 20 [Wickerhamomyces ciferrii]|uniref:Autophagy-related protein 29 n=1 Tax=Wickerhamomyces ciferrii (strain ATCC 14091 / BCRC 22168 / CBS 111 / JCM 3599 / NBRC 0793 / NRRL Y-1031 F-60-10) TaxID=1206466 RepID=K0KGC7_WICCF|nr:Zinc finger and BTB domain-containing protein 20 [Wickerhamomyces ciferrii]CCH40489.1 Zinc finger and BTB domain-containing protein 20 [Wickerhamomyces ciferrii]
MTIKRTVYIKIPRNRDGFVDPPSIRWSEDKERKLWKVLSKSKRNDLDCESEQFGVPISFLQQQAYWLYESELEQLKNEMQRGQTAGTSSKEPSPPKSEPKYEVKSTHNVNELSTSTKSFNIFQPRQVRNELTYEHSNVEFSADPNATLKHVDFDNDIYQTTDGTDEDSDNSSSSSIANLNQESVFLHRSRILTKPPPTFDDSDDDEEDIPLQEDHEAPTREFENVTLNDTLHNTSIGKPKVTTESSLSNISCMYANSMSFLWG